MLSLVFRSRVYEILKMDRTEARALIKCLLKKDMTAEDTAALNCYSTLRIQQSLTYVPKLKSHLPGRQCGNNPYCRVVLGGTRMEPFSMRVLQCLNISGPCVLMMKGPILTLSQTANFRHFLNQRVCRQQFLN